MFRLGWQAGYADPDDFMNVFQSFSENNRTRWKNIKYDDLVNSAAAAGETTERRRIYSEAQRLLLESEAVIAPIFTAVNHFLVAPRVRNYPSNSVELLSYRYVTLSPKRP